jgi:serine/threonine protein phosphatase 1
MRPAPGWLAAGVRVYAIGDVHGCAGRLDALHALIAADLVRRPAERPLLIHLGDAIDRGQDSAGVVGRLASPSPLPGVPMVTLRGNHEQMMLDALTGDAQDLMAWRDNGGDAALRSWGVKRPWKGRNWQADLPSQDVAFLRTLPLTHVVDGYLFVHAGVRPGVPLASQAPNDLLWIRRKFLDWSGVLLPEAPDTGVVHGHTPEPNPVVTSTRIGVDTGAVKGGALTCAVLEGTDVAFLAV